MKRYPNLGPARILDALAFAYDNQDLIEADIAREQELFEQQGGPTTGARPLAQMALPFDEAAALRPPARESEVKLEVEPEKVAPPATRRGAAGARRR